MDGGRGLVGGDGQRGGGEQGLGGGEWGQSCGEQGRGGGEAVARLPQARLGRSFDPIFSGFRK